MASAFVKLQTQDQDLTRVQQNVANAINPLLAGSTWVPLTLLNSWVTYDSTVIPANAVFPPQAAYYLDATGGVWLRGLLANASVTLNSTGSQVALLPSSASPAYDQIFTGFGQWNGVSAVYRIDVLPSGLINVVAVAGDVASPKAVLYLSLDGICFRTSN